MSYGKCSKHNRYSCYQCKNDPSERDNLGQITPNTDGGISIGIGNGLAIDPSDGSLGISTGGITFDT